MESMTNDLIIGSGVVFAFIICAVFVRMAVAKWQNEQNSSRNAYLESLFRGCWNGKHDDIPYAWFRVIQHLRQWDMDDELIRMAEIKRDQCLRIKSDAWIVTQDGQLVNTNGNSNDLEEA